VCLTHVACTGRRKVEKGSEYLVEPLFVTHLVFEAVKGQNLLELALTVLRDYLRALGVIFYYILVR
jgi:hypothetical protein